jgi:flagellar biogenesis protein FliO
MKHYLYVFCTLGMMISAMTFAADNAATPPWPMEQDTVQPPSPDRFYHEFLKMMAILGFILVILFTVTWFLKRFLNVRVQQINATSPIKIVERRALSPKTAIYVIEVYDKHFAFAESHNALAVLGEVHERGEPKGRSFDDVMKA